MEKPDILESVKHLSKCRHESFAEQLKRTPSLFGQMIVESGCLDIAGWPFSNQLMRKSQSVVAALNKQKPIGAAVETMIESLLRILDDNRCSRLLVGLSFVVRI
jgi:hypothetical protein